MPSLRTITAASIGCLLILSSVIWYALPGRMPKTSNITPNDADYPIEKPLPLHFIEVTLLMPESLHLEFSAVYSAHFGRDAQVTPMGCHFLTKTGAHVNGPRSLAEYSVEIPLHLSLEKAPNEHAASVGERIYHALVTVDNFQAGRCHWTLDRVLYRTSGADTSWQLFQFDEDRPGSGMGRREMLSTFWCKTVAARNGVNASETCIGNRADPPEETSVKGIWPVRLGSEATEVQIRIVDEDHIVPSQLLLP